MTTEADELSDDELSEAREVSESSTQTNDQGLGESSQNLSPRRHRQPRSGRQQLDVLSTERDTRRCRSLSNDQDRQGCSPAWTADMDMVDGVQPLADADASPAENGFGRSSLSLSVDNVNTSASSNKRKAVATLPGNDQKSHRMSL